MLTDFLIDLGLAAAVVCLATSMEAVGIVAGVLALILIIAAMFTQ